MQRQITTVSSKGQLVIPADMRTKLGIEPGTRIAITIEDQRIILQPVSDKLIDDTRGMLGSSSLSDELQKQRRADKW